MITTNCGAGVKTPTSCSQWSQFLQPPVPGTLVRSSCAVGLCIYCSSRKACAGSSCLRLGYTDLGDAVHAGWGIPACLTQLFPQRDSIPWARPLCVQFPGHCRNSDQHGMSPRQNVQQGGSSCHCTLAEDSHTMGHHTLSPRAHSSCALLMLPVVLPLLQGDSLLDFSVEAWPLKKINWI